MFLKQTFLYSFLIYFSFAFAQETNIILPNLIDSVNLKVLNFSNGDLLNKVIYEKEQPDFKAVWEGNIKKPEVLITKSGEYIYNNIALRDKKNICPNNKKPVNTTFVKTYLINPTSEINLKTNKYLFHTPSCDQPSFYDILPRRMLILSDPPFDFIEGGDNGILVSSLHIRAFDFDSIELWSLPSYSGGPTRCVYETYTDYFKSNQLSSKVLLKPFYNNFKSQLSNYLAFHSNKLTDSSIQIFWKFENQKPVVYVKSNSLSGTDNYKIQSILEHNIPPPVYEGSYLNTKDTLLVRIFKNNVRFTKGRFNEIYDSLASFEFKNHIRSSLLEQNLIKCMSVKSKVKFLHSKNTFYFDNELRALESTLYKVKCPGPLKSIYAIIPGLGIRQFKGLNVNLEKKSKKILRASLTFATMSIVSKLISDHYYRLFLENSSGAFSKINYTTANTSNKIYLASAGIFTSLLFVDFSWTFALGLKSKKLQHQTNKGLRKLHKNDIWL
jgi:hypothetical protein